MRTTSQSLESSAYWSLCIIIKKKNLYGQLAIFFVKIGYMADVYLIVALATLSVILTVMLPGLSLVSVMYRERHT